MAADNSETYVIHSQHGLKDAVWIHSLISFSKCQLIISYILSTVLTFRKTNIKLFRSFKEFRKWLDKVWINNYNKALKNLWKESRLNTRLQQEHRYYGWSKGRVSCAIWKDALQKAMYRTGRTCRGENALRKALLADCVGKGGRQKLAKVGTGLRVSTWINYTETKSWPSCLTHSPTLINCRRTDFQSRLYSVFKILILPQSQ